MEIRDIALIGILSATITAGKLALSFIPNIEIVTFLMVIYTIVFGLKKTFLASVIFSTTEILIYGLSTWLLGYYIVWPLLILVTDLFNKKYKSEYVYAGISALWGYAFGFFFAIIESIFYGKAYGLTYWISGIPFDLIHGTSNFIIALVLFEPVINILNRLKQSYYGIWNINFRIDNL